MKPFKAKQNVDKLFEVSNEEEFIKYLNTKFSINRKIYKYCPVDENKDVEENYSVINLSNKSIYLSEPKEFNDPFDASMGLSEQSNI